MNELDFVDECYADKDLSLLKKLTLVIPTYNRNFYLSRCLWYHAHFPFGQIIVADSSPEEKKVVNRDTVAKTRESFGANILYLEYEPETEKYGGDIYRKWGDAIQHVQTEYSQICTDKEFLVPTTICMSVAFLDNNSDYSIAEGMDWKIRALSTGDLVFSPWQGTSSFEQDTYEKRFIAYLKNADAVGTLFSIHRSENQKRLYSNLNKYDIYDVRFGETAIEMQPLIFGKSKRIDTCIANCRDVRKLHNHSTLLIDTQNSESSYSRYPALIDYPQEIRQYLSRNMDKCFHELAVDVDLNYKNKQGKTRFISVDELMKKRYPTSNTQLRWWNFLGMAWTRFPSTLQLIIIVCFKIGLTKRIEQLNFPKEMECIQDTIVTYDSFYSQDKAIPFQLSDDQCEK